MEYVILIKSPAYQPFSKTWQIMLKDWATGNAIQLLIRNLPESTDFCLYLKIASCSLAKASYDQNILFIWQNYRVADML